MKKNANQTPTSVLFMRQDFQQDVGHSSDLDQKRYGIHPVLKDHKENETKSLIMFGEIGEDSPQGEWDKMAELMMLKADTQYSDPRVHCPEECLKAKVVENCRSTIAPTRERLKLFFAQLFLLISSVFTEQSQIGVKTVALAMIEQGDLLWKDRKNPLFVPSLMKTHIPMTDDPAQPEEDLLQRF